MTIHFKCQFSIENIRTFSLFLKTQKKFLTLLNMKYFSMFSVLLTTLWTHRRLKKFWVFQSYLMRRSSSIFEITKQKQFLCCAWEAKVKFLRTSKTFKAHSTDFLNRFFSSFISTFFAFKAKAQRPDELRSKVKTF